MLFKILFWIWILETKISQRSLKNTNSNVRGNINYAYCFKCSNFNKKFKSNGFQESIDTHRNRSNRLSSVRYPEHSVEFGNVNSQYLAHLNWELSNLNNTIANNGSSQCYKDLNKVFDMISEPVSSLYSEPIEVDYNSKLKELNTKFGLSLDRIDPLLILKPSQYKKQTRPDLSFEYLTQQKSDNGEVESKLWKRELKEDVPKDLKKQLAKALNEFSKTLGNFFYKFYKDEISMDAMDELFHRASTLGLQATGELFDGLSVLQLKDESSSESLKKSLDLICHYSIMDALRSRCYNKLIDHFFRKNDPDSILEIFKHYVNFSNKKINSLFLTQFLVSLVNQYENKLDELKDNSSLTEIFNQNIEYITDIFKFNPDRKKKKNKNKDLNDQQEIDRIEEGDQNKNKDEQDSENNEKEGGKETFKSKKKKLILELREKLKEGLEMYKENHLSPFNITNDLAEIIEEKFNDIVPGLFRRSKVTGNQEVSGTCKLCRSKIKFDDLSEDEKFELLSKMLESISSSSPNELPGLFGFYYFLRNAKMSGNQYTCIIDGQNIGYSRNSLGMLNWFKLSYSFNFMKSAGENPLIVIPRKGISHLLKNIKQSDPNGYKTIDGMIQNGCFYMTNKYSYDDNFFLLAGMATFSDRELELFQHHMNLHNMNIPENDESGYRNNSNVKGSDFRDNSNNYNTNKDNNGSNIKDNGYSNSSSTDKASTTTKNNKNGNSNEHTNMETNPNTHRTKNVIILTNDRLANLRIDNVDKDLLSKWMNYSLINFNCFLTSGKEIFVLGQRLKYTFDISTEGDKYHIPIGMDRVFSNTMEIHKCSFVLINTDDSPKIILNLYQTEETPIKKWIKNNSHYLYPPSDDRYKQSSEFTDQMYTKGSKNNTDDKNFSKESDVFHRSPEIARLMFSPNWNSSWLCIDMKAFNKLISNL